MKVSNFYEGQENLKDKLFSPIYEDEYLKQVRILLKKGIDIDWHCNDYPILITLIKGNIEFSLREKTFNLKEGDILPLNKKEEHSLNALEDSLILVNFYLLKKF